MEQEWKRGMKGIGIFPRFGNELSISLDLVIMFASRSAVAAKALTRAMSSVLSADSESCVGC